MVRTPNNSQEEVGSSDQHSNKKGRRTRAVLTNPTKGLNEQHPADAPFRGRGTRHCFVESRASRLRLVVCEKQKLDAHASIKLSARPHLVTLRQQHSSREKSKLGRCGTTPSRLDWSACNPMTQRSSTIALNCTCANVAIQQALDRERQSLIDKEKQGWAAPKAAQRIVKSATSFFPSPRLAPPPNSKSSSATSLAATVALLSRSLTDRLVRLPGAA